MSQTRTAPKDQAQLLYDWERNFVEPKVLDFLSKEECLELVGKAAVYSGIPIPRVRVTKSSSIPCQAVPKEWLIIIAAWGRNPVTVLHEVAHLASLDAVFRGEDPHGPTFLARAIQFYSKFLKLSEDYLRQTAIGVGLSLGPAMGTPKLRPAEISSFSDIDF